MMTSPRPGFDQWVTLKGQGEAIDPQFNINGEQKIVSGYVTDILTEYALAFINKAKEKPFMLYLSHKALHPNHHQRDDGSVDPLAESGFIAAERHTGMYANKSFNRRPNNRHTTTQQTCVDEKNCDLAAFLDLKQRQQIKLFRKDRRC
ncbi:MAG: hypothetical protein U5K54_08865 [Cytophagales bacterium]|nr:hypothetical protein [Cytophagales bacterium]